MHPSLAVVYHLLLLVVLIEGEEEIINNAKGALKCAQRAPPLRWVLPYQPQSKLFINHTCSVQLHACYYFRYHGSRTSRSFPIHGCARYATLPPECRGGREHYEPRWTLKIRGIEYEGSIKCCGRDYCNELEEAMFVPVHFNHETAGFFKTYLLFPILLAISLALVFKDYLPDFTWHIRHLLSLENDESEESGVPPAMLGMNPCKMKMLEDEPTLKKIEKRIYTGPNVTGFFNTMQALLETIREIEEYDEVKRAREQRADRERREEREKRARVIRKRHGGRDPYAKDLHINTNICNRQASQHRDSKVFREVPTRLTDLLARLIEHGPYEFPFDPNELGDLFEKASEVLGDEPSVVDLDFGVHIIGNLEGSYIDLFRWFSIFGWPPREKFIFLGGCIHRSNPFSLEVIALLFALKIRLPSHIYIIRGRAEGLPLNMGDRFPPRVTEALREVAAKALTRLPLAAMINKQILCIHSALPVRLSTVEEINQIRRPLTNFHKESLEGYLLNAVPDELFELQTQQVAEEDTAAEHQLDYVDKFLQEIEQRSFLTFLPSDLDETVKRLKLDLIIRARSPCEYGFSAIAEHVISLWSSPVEGGQAAAGIHLDQQGVINLTRLFQFHTYNSDSSDVARDILDKTIAQELERAISTSNNQALLESVQLREPIRERKAFNV